MSVKTTVKNLLRVLLIAPFMLQAQHFIRPLQDTTMTFREMQRQFESFRKSHNLKKERGWKYFKRYEQDMMLHTNGHGEPDCVDEYIKEAIALADFKEANRSKAGTWSPSGPNVLPGNNIGYSENGTGRVNCIAFHPTNANLFYVGVAQGGLWKTTNGGTSYTPLTDNLPITRISEICLDPTNPNTIYISVCDFEYIGTGLFIDARKRNTHYGIGVYKSTDGGTTWSATGLTFQQTQGDASLICRIIVNPSNAQEVLACGTSGMYLSIDGGANWSKKDSGLFWDMVQDPTNGSVIYAATGWVQTSNLGQASIMKSSNFGSTWTTLSTGIPTTGSVQRIRLGIAPTDHNYVYAVTCDSDDSFFGVYHSTDGGTSWTYYYPQLNILEWGEGNDPGGQGTYDLALLINAHDKNTIYVGGINIWGSTDNGQTFNPITHWTTQYGPSIHADVHDLKRQSSTGQIFACTDGGTYRTDSLHIGSFTTTWTTNWSKLNSGIQNLSFYRISSSRNANAQLLGGAQDNGSIIRQGSSWTTIFGGDGMDNWMNPSNQNELIGSSQYGNFYYSNDGGMSGVYASTNPYNESAEWTTPIVGHPTYHKVLYIGNNNLVQSTDGGQNWAPLNSFAVGSPSTEICALAVAPTNSNVVYAARRVRHELGIMGKVFMTPNAGLSYTNITSGLPDSLYFTSIDVSPSSSAEACISMAGFSSGRKVYRTTNNGSTWTNISYDLPNVPVNCVKILGSGVVAAATDHGIYVLQSGATTWVNQSLGLPNVILTDIEVNSSNGKIYVATFGRGIWEASLSDVITSVAENERLANAFTVFPSVNHGQFQVRAPGFDNANVEIVDVMGKLVGTAKMNTEDVSLSYNLLPGAYYVRLVTGNKSAVRKIIVE